MKEELLGKLIAEIHVKDYTGKDIKPATKRFEKLTDTQKIMTTKTQRLNKATGRMRTAFTEVQTPLTGLELASRRFGMTQSRVRRGAEEINHTISDSGELVSMETGQVMNNITAKKKLINANKRFKMELLSVMFFGMAIQRTFGGMVRQVMELTGVFEVWKATLVMILLPILLPFTRFLMKIMFYFMQHKELAKFTGWFIILAAALGAVMAYIGIIGLGLGGLSKTLPSLILAFNKLYKALFLLAGTIFEIAAVLLTEGPLAAIALLNTKLKALTGPWKIVILLAAAWLGLNLSAWILKHIKEPMEEAADWVVDKIEWIISYVEDKLGIELKERVAKWARTKLEFPGWKLVAYFEKWALGEKQYGGYIPRTGLYKLHAGETVTPAGGLEGGGMTINVNAAVSSEMDIKRLADRISIELGRNFEREYGRRAL